MAGVVVQNAPAFGEPIGGPSMGDSARLLEGWFPGPSRRRPRSSLTPQAVRNQYLAGIRGPSLIDPDSWTIDTALLARPGVDEIMLDLIYDIKNNRKTVSEARQFFGVHQQQVMIATDVNDPLFPGASMKPPADMPDIEFNPINSGHLRWRITARRSSV